MIQRRQFPNWKLLVRTAPRELVGATTVGSLQPKRLLASDKADAVLKTGGSLVDCYRFRGDILDHRSDWAAAQKAYADAVALAPDVPARYYSWGVGLAKHGDLAGAEAKLKDANQRGPHCADPLKAWGDVLVERGHSKDALAKYDEALKYAPNWKQLKEAREATAKKT